MTLPELTPIERTQLIEMRLNTYQPGSPNLVQINDLDNQVAKIDSVLGYDADVRERLEKLCNFISILRLARKVRTLKIEEEEALCVARTANLALRRVIIEKLENN